MSDNRQMPHKPSHTPPHPPRAPEKEKPADGSEIKKVIGVGSGKGGVGKSFVTANLAVALAKKGLKVGIMDADITGPSIPQAFGLKGMLRSVDGTLIEPETTDLGIKIVSVNLLMADPNQPVVWRGPVLSGIIGQFWSEVNWGTLDVLLIDMPPGTADVPLTVFQTIPLDGFILVATGQDLAAMIVNKARNMASMMNVPILGMVENMSYVKCPHCDEVISLFGDGSAVLKSAEEIGVPVLASIPLDPAVTRKVDSGKAEECEIAALADAVDTVAALL
ncbi:MAG: Mrp/NBP35 family ATP-binding protein [Clostridiales bacterium]|nr:Mrp/NBP35 family ATP-binding protein [Clostridiales bacterium]